MIESDNTSVRTSADSMTQSGVRAGKIVVIVPAFNEEGSIKQTIESIRGLTSDLSAMGLGLEIYIIDDGSVDRTRMIAEEARADRILRHRVNRGLGAAVRTGMLAGRDAQAHILIKFDADQQHDARDILDLIKPIM